MSLHQIENYRDSNGWKLQHIASHWGHQAAVNKLIEHACDFDEKIDGKSATEMAYERGHFEILLNLFKANFCFPKKFDQSNVSDELKSFVVLSENFHVSVRNQEIAKIEQTLSENSNLKYFYNIENKSALKYALEFRKIGSYETLITGGLSLGAHEHFLDIISDYQRSDQIRLRELHVKLAPTILAEPIATLNQNSFFGPNCPNGQEHRNFVSEAYYFLFTMVGLTSVLNAVAASRTFKIIYDFSRDAVTYIDPTSDQNN
jgi:ankyrin repeat protein